MDEILNLEVSLNTTLDLAAFRQRKLSSQPQAKKSVSARVIPLTVKQVPVQTPVESANINLTAPELSLGLQWNPLTGKFEA